ncbi:Mitogen-activated protein kinase 9 [Orobanche gracilis]
MIQDTPFKDFFTEYGEANLYEIQEVVGKGSYGVVAAAVDTHTGKKVAIKKINNIFDHVSEATRILREIKLLRLLRHPDIVEIKHIMLPPCRREFKDIYVVFELMETDLHHVIKTNDDLTPGHHQFFLYQLLRALKYIHSANVFHRDLKPKNILANADCKLKICDFGLARASFGGDAPSAVFWTDYVATRWYRAPELCGSFFSKYTPAIDIWSIGCIFAEMVTSKPLFPGKNVVHQLDLITDLLGSPSAEAISRVIAKLPKGLVYLQRNHESCQITKPLCSYLVGIRNEKARRYLSSMRKKPPVPLSQRFPNIDPLALRLLARLIAFDPKDRPSAEEALADPYFHGLANVEDEPSTEPISKFEFEFERRTITKDDVRELIYREQTDLGVSSPDAPGVPPRRGPDSLYVSKLSGLTNLSNNFSALRGNLVKWANFLHEDAMPPCPGERICGLIDEDPDENRDSKSPTVLAIPRPKKSSDVKGGSETTTSVKATRNGSKKSCCSARCLLRSDSISASKCIGVQGSDYC